MNEIEKHQKVNLIFESVLNSIETGDHRRITNCFNDLHRIEIDFLNEHSNRKKEGAYYTRESVSNFIVSQGVLLFLSKFLKNDQISSLEDVYNLDDDLKSRI